MKDRDLFGPDGERALGSGVMRARRETEGTVHFDDKEPFILSREPWDPPKPRRKSQPDTLSCQLDEAWSQMRTEQLGRPVFYFKVRNLTSDTEYTTELFEGVMGEPCGNCNCPSAKVCKHIIQCLIQVLTRWMPTFGEAEERSQFMVGLKLVPAQFR